MRSYAQSMQPVRCHSEERSDEELSVFFRTEEDAMKKNLMISILMTIVTTILLGIIYPLVVTGLAQVLFPRQGQRPADRARRQGDRLANHRADIYRPCLFPLAAIGRRQRL